MPNNYYSPTGKPSTLSTGSSSEIRNEFNLVTQGFDKLPSLSVGTANNIATVNSSGTALTTITDTELLTKIKTVDGAGSGLDADTLDGQQGAYYLPASTYTASDVLTKIKAVDGAGSGLDADTLDGLDSASFSLTGHTHSYLPLAGGTVNGDISVNGVLNTAHQINVGYGEPSLSEIIMFDNVDGYRVMRCDNHIGFLNTSGGWGAYCNDAGDWVATTRMTCANAPTLGTDLANKDYVDTKLTASTYTAADVLTKIKTVDGSGSGLDADTLDGYQASSFLIGSTWTNVIGSRADSVTYTNTTGKTIQVSVKVTLWASGDAHLYIGGVAVSGFSHTTAGTFTFTNMIPPGVTYLLLLGGSVAITGWYELI